LKPFFSGLWFLNHIPAPIHKCDSRRLERRLVVKSSGASALVLSGKLPDRAGATLSEQHVQRLEHQWMDLRTFHMRDIPKLIVNFRLQVD
jgi:hypothetical protein